MESYSTMEFRKLIMEVDSSTPGTKITYIGVADYASNLLPNGFAAASDTTRAIRKIKKMIDTTVGTTKTTETLFPVGDARDNFVRDDHLSLTYL